MLEELIKLIILMDGGFNGKKFIARVGRNSNSHNYPTDGYSTMDSIGIRLRDLVHRDFGVTGVRPDGSPGNNIHYSDMHTADSRTSCLNSLDVIQRIRDILSTEEAAYTGLLEQMDKSKTEFIDPRVKKIEELVTLLKKDGVSPHEIALKAINAAKL